MEENKSNITFNISGGNNQILPNATHAVQYFYGDKLAKDGIDNQAEDDSSDASSEETSHEENLNEGNITKLSLYIPESETLQYYIDRLKVCATATELAQVAMEICNSHEIERVDKEVVVKRKFIEVLLALCPQITKGNSISNIRARINDLLTKR